MKLIGINDKIVIFDKDHALNIEYWEDWMDDDMDIENPSEEDIVIGFSSPEIYEEDDLMKAAKDFEALYILSKLEECENLFSWPDVNDHLQEHWLYFRLDKWKQLKERINND